MAQRTARVRNIWPWRSGFFSAQSCPSSVALAPSAITSTATAECLWSRTTSCRTKTWANMNSLALINEFLGQPPNASEHGYQIDHILEFSHWFMAALFLGGGAFFFFVLFRFGRRPHPVADHRGVKSGFSTPPEFSFARIAAVF